MKTLKVGVRVKMIALGFGVPVGTVGECTGIRKKSAWDFNYLIKWSIEEYTHVNPFDKTKCTWAKLDALEVL